MIFTVVFVLLSGYLASCNFCPRESAAGETVVLLGGFPEGRTETFPDCDVEIADIVPQDGLGAAVHNGIIIYCGGVSQDRVGHRRNCYKNKNGKWVEIESMYTGRSWFTLTNMGNKLIAAGGYTPKSVITDSMEIYDGTWSGLLPFTLKPARNSFCTVPISPTSVMMIGGRDSNGDNIKLVQIYDLKEGLIDKPVEQLPQSRSLHACALYKDEVWVTGGRYSVDVYIYNFTDDSWRSGPSLNIGRDGHTTHVVNGNLMVFGGIGGNGGVEKSTEFLDNDIWVERENLKFEHAFHASVVVPCK